MRTALLLLLLLALASIPGSLLPQQGVDSLAVARFRLEHPDLSPWVDRLDGFDVYASPWFSAIYLLLGVSLVGCIIPRCAVYARALRRRPPATPARLDRMPAYAEFDTSLAPAEALSSAAEVLRRRGFRVDADEHSVRAEKGYLREAGNLVFHVSLLGVLVGVAIGSLWGYRGNAIVVEGSSFSNTLTQYDEFRSGALADFSSLPPFTVSIDEMTATFQTEGAVAGQPASFEAVGEVTPQPGSDSESFEISVNHPLGVDGTSVFLVGSGYAPVVTVRDGEGSVVSSEPVPFLPVDASYVSEGVIKAPDARPAQLGLEGFFLPTAARDADGLPRSVFPEAANPALSLFVWQGDLGLDGGEPQSVYTLDKDELTVVEDVGGEPERLLLQPGDTAVLPDGLGSVTFEGVQEFAGCRSRRRRCPGCRCLRSLSRSPVSCCRCTCGPGGPGCAHGPATAVRWWKSPCWTGSRGSSRAATSTSWSPIYASLEAPHEHRGPSRAGQRRGRSRHRGARGGVADACGGVGSRP
jgi:cytochrome c biogenesis protein